MRLSSSTSSLPLLLTTLLLSCTPQGSLSGLLSEPVSGRDHPYTAPAFPVQTQPQICKLDLSAELFGGVSEACGRTLDRSRCCPVLAAWLFAAHARWALQLPSGSALSSTTSDEMPMMPDDAQKCADSLQTALVGKNVHLPQPNSTCDTILCFCGIRLHQISSLSCPAAFNVTTGLRNATPTAAVRGLEKSCRNSSYSGCTKCLGALQKLKGSGQGGPNETSGDEDEDVGGDRARKMFDRDCQLMGLTWLLARNKTAYIPTVSAVLRAIMYSSRPPHGRHRTTTTTAATTCSPDQENMPLAVDSLELERSQSWSSSSSYRPSIHGIDSDHRWIRTIVLVMTMLIAMSV